MSPHETFWEAIGLMPNLLSAIFFVVEDDGRLAGVASDRNFLSILARTLEWQSTTVGNVMMPTTATVYPDPPLV